MKVILLEDVKSVGKKGQIVNVSDGYGNNFLLPKRLAVLATKTSLGIKDKEDALKKEEDEKRRLEALDLKNKLTDCVVKITAKAGEMGKMYGAISTKQIVEELKKQYGYEIDKRKILNNNNLTEFGTHLLEVELYKGVIGKIKVNIEEK